MTIRLRLPRPVLRRSVPGVRKARRSGRIRLPRGLLAGADVVVVDVETTGWLADSAAITEIGAVRLASDQPIREFSALVNPGAPIPADITALTGITDDMVASAPPIAEVLPRFIDFARDGVIVAHNAPFDLGFLTAACAASGIDWPPCAVVDTAVLARLLLVPGAVPDHKLTTLACYFGTGTDPCHRALADARATAGVLGGLLSLAVRYDYAAVGGRRVRSGRSSDPGGGDGHSDCSDQGRCHAHPRDGGDYRPDHRGQRGLFGHRRIRPGRDGAGARP